MKKNVIKFSIMLLLILALSFTLFNNILKFNHNNVASLTLSRADESFVLDKDGENMSDLITKLGSLKQYKRAVEPPNQKMYVLTLEMKHSGDQQFNIYLDYDFSTLYITDVNEAATYLIEGAIVEQIYMLEALASFYEYKEPQKHKIYFQNNEITASTQSNWSYIKGDNKWHDINFDQTTISAPLLITDNSHEFYMDFMDGPVASYLVVYQDEVEIYNADLKAGFYLPTQNGIYNYSVTSTWESDRYRGQYSSEFSVECAYQPEFSVSKEKLELGEYTTITGRNIHKPELLFIHQSLADNIEFVKRDDVYECVIPATYYTKVGNYDINYGLEGDYENTFSLEVVDREFSIQYLEVSKNTESSTRTDAAYEEYHKYYKPALEKNVYEANEDFLNAYAFILPVNGRLSTEFGERRYVNGSPTSYNHAGFDIASPTGSLVKSTYKGEVVLAKKLQLTGNSLVINHGNGIYSTYFHLDEMLVDQGQVVRTGQNIGKVGTTGFSTGPHLHFSISYHKMNLEPGFFIYGEKVTYGNYETLFNN